MNVYIITKESFPHGMAATNRIKCYAKAILSQGLSCEVLIYTRTEIYGKSPKNTTSKGNYEGIPYKYMANSPQRKPNVFLRKVCDYLDRLHIFIYLFKNLKKGDVVFCFSPGTLFISLIIWLAHLKKAKFIKELCEYPYGTGKETKMSIIKRKYLLNRQFPTYDGIIVISDNLFTLASQYSSKSCKIIKIPILVDFEKFYLEDQSDEAETPYIFHAGTLYEQKDGILGMFEAFGKASEIISKDIHFICTGIPQQSPHHQAIQKIIDYYKISDKLTFVGYLYSEQIKEYLSKATLVFLNKHPNQQNTYGFSTKLGEYLAAGKPVIITKVGEAMNWLKDGESAYIVKPDDTDLLAQAIVNAINDPEKRKMIALNGQKVCKECFNYRNYGEKLQLFFNSITHSNT